MGQSHKWNGRPTTTVGKKKPLLVCRNRWSGETKSSPGRGGAVQRNRKARRVERDELCCIVVGGTGSGGPGSAARAGKSGRNPDTEPGVANE